MEEWQEAFVQVLREGHTVEMASRTAGVSRMTAYRHRKTDPAFAEAWEHAYESGTDVLEQVAIKRAIEHDSQLLMFMLKARRPEKYRENSRIEHVRIDYREGADELELLARKILREDQEEAEKLKELPPPCNK